MAKLTYRVNRPADFKLRDMPIAIHGEAFMEIGVSQRQTASASLGRLTIMTMATRRRRLTHRIERTLVGCGAACWLAGVVFLWMTLPPEPRATMAAQELWVAGFSGDGKSFMTTGEAPWQHIDVRDISDGTILSRIDVCHQAVGPATTSPDGRLLAFPTKILIPLIGVESDPKPAVIIWDVENNRERYRLDAAEGPVAFAPDNRLIATGDSTSMGSVLVWDLTNTGSIFRSFTVSAGPIQSLEFSPNGNHFVAVGQQLTFSIELMNQFADTSSVSRRPASPLLPNGGAIWWTTHDWQQTGQVPNESRSMTNSAAGFVSADRLAVARNNLPREVKLIDIATSGEQLTIPIPPGASNLEPNISGAGIVGVMYYRSDVLAEVQEWVSANLSGPKRTLYLPSSLLHDAKTGVVRARLPVDPRRAYLSPDGQTVVSWEAGKLSVWDVPPSRLTFIWMALSAAIAVPIIAFNWCFIRRLRWSLGR